MRESRRLQDNETVAFVAGVVVGIMAGMLLAPRAGAEIRESLKAYAAQAMEDILDTTLHTARTYLDDLVRQGKDYIDTTVEEILEPVKKLGETR
jgi:gas vesicle protein